MELPDIIKHMRQEAGMTQSELGKAVAARTRDICEYEVGEKMPTFAKFNDICSALGYKVVIKKIEG